MSPHYLVKCPTFSSDRRYSVCCIPPNVGGTERSRLWCVANGMPDKQRYSKCSNWPLSARIHASSLFRHWSTASSNTLCWNSAHVTTRRFRNSSVSRIDWLIGWLIDWSLLKHATNVHATNITTVTMNWYSIRVKKWKRWKICAFYKAVWWHFLGVVGKGVTVCFLLR